MEEHNEEIYERIPWEAMSEPTNDRQWWILGLAAAIVAGALGYSFMSNRPLPMPESAAQSVPPVDNAPQVPAPTDPAAPTNPAALPPVTPPTAPAPVAEADLFAAAPVALASLAENHAVWFVREFLASDGSDVSNSVLRSLLPADIPVPTGDALVFVEWAGVQSSEEVSPGKFRVDVIARYLTAPDGGEYQRAEPIVVTVDVDVASSVPTIVTAPTFTILEPGESPPIGLGPVPEEITALAIERVPGAEVVGGTQDPSGTWTVVVLALVDGISRPMGISINP